MSDQSCATCAHSRLRDKTDANRDKYLQKMARHGFANCSLSPFRASFHPKWHTCKAWALAPYEILDGRKEWIEKTT
jgi:hypothetical protein